MPLDTPRAMPNTPSVPNHWCDMALEKDAPFH